MLSHILAVLTGAAGATVIWFFVLKNNSKKINDFVNNSEAIVKDFVNDLEDLTDEAKAKVEAFLKEELKKLKK